MPTVLPFHRAVVSDPAFAPVDDSPFTVHTRWIETEFDNTIEPYAAGSGPDDEQGGARKVVVVEVDGRRLEVSLPAELALGSTGVGTRKKAPKRGSGSRGGSAASGDSPHGPDAGHDRQGRGAGGRHRRRTGNWSSCSRR